MTYFLKGDPPAHVSARRLIKETAARAWFAAGIPQRRLKGLGGHLIVLTYHSFSEEAGLSPGSHMPIALFEEQLRFLGVHTTIVSLSDGLSTLDGSYHQDRAGDRPCVALTVDDGFDNNHDVLFPVLKKYGATATLFVATNFIDSGRPPWPTELRETLEATERREVLEPCNISLRTPSDRAKAGGIMWECLKGLPPVDRLAELDHLRDRLGVPPGWHAKPLTWAQLREMCKHGIEVGSHTQHHSVLPCVGTSVQREEIYHSKSLLEASLGAPCRLFSYPNGDWSESTRQLVRSAGFNYAVTQDWGANLPGDNPFCVRRIEVPFYESLPVFASRVSLLLSPRRNLPFAEVARRS